jgi:hypothetical protein
VATAELKAAVQMRTYAARAVDPAVIKVLRAEMRYYAKKAVTFARRYRNFRSS